MATQPRCASCGLTYAAPPGGGPACRCAWNFAPLERVALSTRRDDLQRRLWALAELPRETSMEGHTPAATRFFTPSPWPDRAASEGADGGDAREPRASGGDGPGWSVRAG